MRDFYEVVEKFKPWNINKTASWIELISLLLSLGLHKSAASVQNRRNLFDFRISIHFVPPQEIQSQNEVEHHATTEMYKMSKMLEFLLSCSCFFPSKEFVILPPLITTQNMRAAMFWIESVSFFCSPTLSYLWRFQSVMRWMSWNQLWWKCCNSHTWYVFGQN